MLAVSPTHFPLCWSDQTFFWGQLPQISWTFIPGHSYAHIEAIFSLNASSYRRHTDLQLLHTLWALSWFRSMMWSLSLCTCPNTWPRWWCYSSLPGTPQIPPASLYHPPTPNCPSLFWDRTPQDPHIPTSISSRPSIWTATQELHPTRLLRFYIGLSNVAPIFYYQ